MTDRELKIKEVLGYEATDTQLNLLKFLTNGVGNAVVQSMAGSGKSSTIKLLVKFIPENKKVLIIAHNRHIRDEIKNKIGDCSNVTVLTYHALGYKILRQHLGNKPIDDNKYKNYLYRNIEVLDPESQTMSRFEKNRYCQRIERIIDYCMYNFAQSAKEINKMIVKYDIRTSSNEVSVVHKMLKWGQSNLDTLSLQDLIWLPFELGYAANIKSMQYDYIFVDEAQDSSIAQQKLIDMCIYRKTRIFCFGDKKQTINSWCGADEDAFTNFNKRPNTKQFKLSKSFRCSKAVAHEVKTIVPDFEVFEGAKEGKVIHDATISNIKPGDLVLCRFSAPLIKLGIKLLEKGYKISMKDTDIVKDTMVKLSEMNGRTTKEFISELYGDLFKMWDDKVQQYECNYKEALSDGDIVRQYNTVLTFESLSEGLTTESEIRNRLEMLMNDDSTNDKIIKTDKINLFTVHKAKGLECKNVFILCPSLMPSKFAVTDMDVTSEDNLIYVAWSRALENLYFVSERDFSPNKGYCDMNELYKELKEKKEKFNGNFER